MLLRAVWGPRATAATDATTAAARRAATIGVAAVVLAFLVLGGLRVVTIPPFAPPDETSHVAYAFALLEWEIPHIAEFPEELPIPHMRKGLSVWTANHPPGTYALLAVPLALGRALDVPLAGFWGARLLNVLAAATALLLIARIAATLMPERPRLVLGGVLIAAFLPYYLQVAATAYTDGIALLCALAVAAASVEVLVRGPSRKLLVVLCASGAAAALARAPFAVLVLLSGGAWGVAVLLHDARHVAASLRRGFGGAALIGLCAAAASGWFYLGNVALYGDPTGSEALFALHGRQPRGPLWWQLSAVRQFNIQAWQLWSRLEGLPSGMEHVIGRGFVEVAVVVTRAAVVTAIAAAAWALWRGRTRPGRAAAWTFLVLWWAALWAMMALFASRGGGPHARYLWPGIAGSALVLAVGLEVWRVPLQRSAAAGMPGPLRYLGRLESVPLGLLVAGTALVWALLTGWARAVAVWGLTEPGRDVVRATVDVLVARRLPAPTFLVVAAFVVLAAALVAVVWSLLATPSRVVPGTCGDGAPAERSVGGGVEGSGTGPSAPGPAASTAVGSGGA